MTVTVTVVDYGMGNLFSVARAFEHCGAKVVLIDAPDELAKASHLVLPGVGAFADGMRELRERSLVEPLVEFAASGRPFLGICLGMQMLLDASEEFGEHLGLGIVAGRVQAIPATGTDGTPHKIPHIGWNGLTEPERGVDWNGSILEGVTEKAAVYFVHSYTAVPDSAEHRLADCYYDGRLISAVLRAGSVSGCQFHPEKSGPVGLHIVRNFLRMT